jgi:hypothetical protein
MTGEISLVVTSLAEQQQLIRGGKLRPLAMLIKDDFDRGRRGRHPQRIHGLSQPVQVPAHLPGHRFRHQRQGPG